MNERKKRNFSSPSLIYSMILLFAGTIIMGLVMMQNSKIAMREQISQRMLDITNTAAYMMDGDALAVMQKEDAGTPAYEQAMDTLRNFQENINLEYIYGIRAEEDGTFTFTVDPTVDDPGEFGSPIVTTDALKLAAQGTAAVDKEPYEDDWGRFYSAYSPVFDSKGNVAGIIAVDFSASWYEHQIARHMVSIMIVSGVTLLLGMALCIRIATRNRRRFTAIDDELRELDKELAELNRVMKASSVMKLGTMADSEQRFLLETLASGEDFEDSSNDELADIGHRLHSMQNDLRRYITFVNSQTYIDPLTGVGNTAAYQQTVRQMDADLYARKADFRVIFFDINELKNVNVRFGADAGDKLLSTAARILRQTFSQKHVYRVASDEFIVVLPGVSEEETKAMLTKMDAALTEYNSENGSAPDLFIARGIAANEKGDRSFRQIFRRAYEASEEDKREYYRRKNES